jgi:hypothetical protein
MSEELEARIFELEERNKGLQAEYGRLKMYETENVAQRVLIESLQADLKNTRESRDIWKRESERHVLIMNEMCLQEGRKASFYERRNEEVAKFKVEFTTLLGLTPEEALRRKQLEENIKLMIQNKQLAAKYCRLNSPEWKILQTEIIELKYACDGIIEPLSDVMKR